VTTPTLSASSPQTLPSDRSTGDTEVVATSTSAAGSGQPTRGYVRTVGGRTAPGPRPPAL